MQNDHIAVGDTVILLAELDPDGNPDPLVGLSGVVIEEFPRTPAGFECAVALDVDAVRRRLGLATDDPQWQAEVRRHVRGNQFVVEADRTHLQPHGE
jgi:hypothetical protein